MKGQHGFARTVPWNICVSNGGNCATCNLAESEATLSLWPHKFRLTCSIQLLENALCTSFTVENTGESAFDFTSLLHTYFQINEIGCVTIDGLQNLTYADKLKGNQVFVEGHKEIRIDSEVDRTYINYPKRAILHSPNGQLELKSEGFCDLVVWNPWIEKSKAMADFDDEEYNDMICIEAGKVNQSVTLLPRGVWTGSQTLTVF